MSIVAAHLRLTAWDEKPVSEFEDGSKITRADVTLADGDHGVESGRFASVMFYRPDGTSHYAIVMRLVATLDDRTGTFALSGEGYFDDTTASYAATVVPDSATGQLVGITGACTSDSTHADYPFMPLVVTYELP